MFQAVGCKQQKKKQQGQINVLEAIKLTGPHATLSTKSHWEDHVLKLRAFSIAPVRKLLFQRSDTQNNTIMNQLNSSFVSTTRQTVSTTQATAIHKRCITYPLTKATPALVAVAVLWLVSATDPNVRFSSG